MSDATPFPALRLRLGEIQRTSPTLELRASEEERAAIADALDLAALLRFEADASTRPWLDGAEIRAQWSAAVRQTCGVSLEPFDTDLQGEFTIRVLPSGSAAAAPLDADVCVDPEADDPPDILAGDIVDVGAYLVEHLALEIDPFPRKPGVVYAPPPEERPPSPFAALQALRLPPEPS